MYVECIEASDCKGYLTKGKEYMIYDLSATGYRIFNDVGESIWVGQSCFRLKFEEE